MKSLKITPDALKNQQDVVSEEVRVNVLNQPHAARSVAWPAAEGEHELVTRTTYGDLAELEAANLDDVKKFYETLRAEQRGARGVGRHDAGRSDEARRKAFRRDPSRRCRRGPTSGAAANRRETFTEGDKLARRQRWRSATTCRIA